MSKPAGIGLPAGFPRALAGPTTAATLILISTIFLVPPVRRDLLTLRR
jgi:hypothetical protein